MSMINYERLSRVWCTWVLGCVVVLVAAMLGSASPASAKLIYIPGVSFGSEGSGNGQFKEPVGVAANDSSEPLVQPAAGDVYVVDKGNNRVERFSSTGVYLGQFDGSGTFEVEGKIETGTAAPTGAFSSPEEVAVDNSNDPLDPSAGDVYVLDNGHDVVDKFSATGAYLGQLTGGSVQPASFVDVTVDPSGNVWTLDTKADVEECDSTGVCEKKFQPNLGSVGRGFVVDSQQDVYINWGGEESVAILRVTSILRRVRRVVVGRRWRSKPERRWKPPQQRNGARPLSIVRSRAISRWVSWKAPAFRDARSAGILWSLRALDGWWCGRRIRIVVHHGPGPHRTRTGDCGHRRARAVCWRECWYGYGSGAQSSVVRK